MKLKHLLFLFALIIFTFSSVAQAQTNTSTDVNKDVDVTKVYEQVVKEGYGTPLIYKDLANAYYFKSNYAMARKWYEKLFSVEPPTDETLKFRYKQSLKALNANIEKNKYLSSPAVGTN
ncbi:MAG: hypothetical protein MK211_08305 [Flavobacteriales bacterium]|jgi:hypothetical protein|nr:hypothetical protein [Flavobacteriales bacterium]